MILAAWVTLSVGWSPFAVFRLGVSSQQSIHELTLELLTRQEITRINSLGERLRLGLRSALADTGVMGQVTGVGSLLQIHFSETEVTDYRAGKRTAPLQPLQLLHLMLLNHGVSIAPRGLMCISTSMDKQDINHTVSVSRRVGRARLRLAATFPLF